MGAHASGLGGGEVKRVQCSSLHPVRLHAQPSMLSIIAWLLLTMFTPVCIFSGRFLPLGGPGVAAATERH